jgi:hypothetical protein
MTSFQPFAGLLQKRSKSRPLSPEEMQSAAEFRDLSMPSFSVVPSLDGAAVSF